jgi:hypothetical protein
MKNILLIGLILVLFSSCKDNVVSEGDIVVGVEIYTSSIKVYNSVGSPTSVYDDRYSIYTTNGVDINGGLFHDDAHFIAKTGLYNINDTVHFYK